MNRAVQDILMSKILLIYLYITDICIFALHLYGLWLQLDYQAANSSK